VFRRRSCPDASTRDHESSLLLPPSRTSLSVLYCGRVGPAPAPVGCPVAPHVPRVLPGRRPDGWRVVTRTVDLSCIYRYVARRRCQNVVGTSSVGDLANARKITAPCAVGRSLRWPSSVHCRCRCGLARRMNRRAVSFPPPPNIYRPASPVTSVSVSPRTARGRGQWNKWRTTSGEVGGVTGVKMTGDAHRKDRKGPRACGSIDEVNKTSAWMPEIRRSFHARRRLSFVDVRRSLLRLLNLVFRGLFLKILFWRNCPSSAGSVVPLPHPAFDELDVGGGVCLAGPCPSLATPRVLREGEFVAGARGKVCDYYAVVA